MRWPAFAGAALVAAVLLLSAGAPPLAILAGTGIVAAWNFFRRGR